MVSINLLCPTGKSAKSRQAPHQKIFLFVDTPTHRSDISRPIPARGAYRDRHERWDGMRWTRQRWRAMRSQGGLQLCERCTARKTNDADAYGKTVWSWHPLLVSSRRRCCGPTGLRCNLNPLATVTRRIRRRGERDISRKAIAQGMSDCLRCPVCSCAHFLCTLHTRPRVQRASGIPCALYFRGRKISSKPRAQCAARTRSRVLSVIASEAKQSIARHNESMDCFVAYAPVRKRFAFVAGNDGSGS